MTEDNLGKITAEIKNGEFKGEELEIEISERPTNSEIRINDEVLTGVQKAVIEINAQKNSNTVNLELDSRLMKQDEDDN